MLFIRIFLFGMLSCNCVYILYSVIQLLHIRIILITFFLLVFFYKVGVLYITLFERTIFHPADACMLYRKKILMQFPRKFYNIQCRFL